jgi:hypothetical protein
MVLANLVGAERAHSTEFEIDFLNWSAHKSQSIGDFRRPAAFNMAVQLK